MIRRSLALTTLCLVSMAASARAQYHPHHAFHPGLPLVHPGFHHFHPGFHHPYLLGIGVAGDPAAPYASGYVPYASAATSYAGAAASYAYGSQMQYQRQALELTERQFDLQRQDVRQHKDRVEARGAEKKAVRQRRAEGRLAAENLQKPERLAVEELSPAGVVEWPEALGGKEFEDFRAQIEGFFAARAVGGETVAGAGSVRDMQRLAEKMSNQLKPYAKQLGGRDYLAAQSFLKRLAVEARSETGITQLAGP